MQIGTNHLGHFALTNLLLPQITDRVVVVASGGAPAAGSTSTTSTPSSGYSRHRAYGQSKLANLLFTLELQRRLEAAGSTVQADAAHPGWASTNLQGHSGNRVESALMAVGNRVIAQSDEMGALPTLYAATQDLPGDTYIGPGGPGSCAAIRRRRPQRRRADTEWRRGCGRRPSASPACHFPRRWQLWRGSAPFTSDSREGTRALSDLSPVARACSGRQTCCSPSPCWRRSRRSSPTIGSRGRRSSARPCGASRSPTIRSDAGLGRLARREARGRR